MVFSASERFTTASIEIGSFSLASQEAWRSRVNGETYREPARRIPVYARTDVLVVGGGPAGTAAALAAARLGADVTLVERYGHLGGMSTGGLVLWIDRMTDWSGRQVISGVGSELLDRLPREARLGPSRELWGSSNAASVGYWAERSAAFRDVVTYSPTIDPEWLKIVSLNSVVEAGAHLMLHSWATAPIVEGARLKGVIFESKEGRQAVYAEVVVDATGDGDLYALAGAPFETDTDESNIHHCMNVAWLWAGVDMERWLAFTTEQPDEYAAFTRRGTERFGFLERPHVGWRNDVALFMGPRLAGFSPLRVADLTAVEYESRRRMLEHLAYYRQGAPGFGSAWIMLSAPQTGLRHSRRLVGRRKVLHAEWQRGVVHDDEIGVSPPPSPQLPNISVPYGSLVPSALENILAAGRHVSCDPQSHVLLREIPQCWLTGHAAGAAAGLAAMRGVSVRDIDVAELQQVLTRQGVYLSRSAATAEAVAVP